MKIEIDSPCLITDLTLAELHVLRCLTNDPVVDQKDNEDEAPVGSQFKYVIDRVLDGVCGYKSLVVRARRHMTVVGWSMYDVIEHCREAKAGFYVAPDFRRQGIGTMLMDKVKESLRASGQGIGTLIVEPWSSGGDAFFEKAGARVIRRRDAVMSSRCGIAL